jgi:hypothetical protein
MGSVKRTGPLKRTEAAAARRADRTRPAASWENARMFPRIPGLVRDFVRGFVHGFVHGFVQLALAARVALAAPTALFAGPGRASSPAFAAGAAAFATLGMRGAPGTE